MGLWYWKRQKRMEGRQIPPEETQAWRRALRGGQRRTGRGAQPGILGTGQKKRSSEVLLSFIISNNFYSSLLLSVFWHPGADPKVQKQKRTHQVLENLCRCAETETTRTTTSSWGCFSGIWQRNAIPGFSEAITILRGIRGIQMRMLQPQIR